MKKLVALLAAFIFAFPVFAAEAPAWTGNYVNDYAGILGDSSMLELMLADIERNSTVEFAIVTVSAIPSDETKETYSYKIFNAWGIGKKDENNGLLLLMIANGTPGNRMRMEIGYGLEGYITDASAGRMLDEALPFYEAGDYSQAAYVIVSEVKRVLNEKYFAVSETDFLAALNYIFLSPILPVIIIGIIILVRFRLTPRCPKCGSRRIAIKGERYVCSKCGHTFKKKKRAYLAPWVFVGGSGGGFGGGGFGGGGSGGGGAGR